MPSKAKQDEKLIREERYAFYLRVSTENQVKDETMEIQEQAANNFIHENKIEIDKCKFFRDKGISGALDGDKRRDFSELYGEIVQNRISCVWIYSTSRLARETYIFAPFLHELKKRNIRFFVSSKEYNLNKPEENLMISIFSAFDAYERNQITLRTSSGRNRLKDEGKLIVPRLYGYSHKIKDMNIGKRGRKIVEPIQEQLTIMKSVIEAFLSGKNYNQIAKMVGFGRSGDWKDKILHPEYYGMTKNSRGVLIQSQLYKSLFSNDFKENEEIFNRIQALVETAKSDYFSKTHLRKASGEVHYYSGLISCAYCNEKYYYNRQLRIENRDDRYEVYQHYKINVPKDRKCETNSRYLRFKTTNSILDCSYNLYYLLKNVFRQDFFRAKEKLEEENRLREEIELVEKDIIRYDTKLSFERNCLSNSINNEDLGYHRDEEIKCLKILDELKSQLRKLKTALNEGSKKVQEHDEALANLNIENYKKQSLIERRETLSKIIHSIKVFQDYTLVISSFTNSHFIFNCKVDERYKDSEELRSLKGVFRMVGQSVNFHSNLILNKVVLPEMRISKETMDLLPQIIGFPLKVFDFRGFNYPSNLDWELYLKSPQTNFIPQRGQKKSGARLGRVAGKVEKGNEPYPTKLRKVKGIHFNHIFEILYPNGNKSLK